MPIKVVFLDCDGTLTTIRSSWEYLHRSLNLWTENADAYQALFRAGKIDYYEFCRRDALLWRGLPLSRIHEMVRQIPYREGVRDGMATLKRLGIFTVIISTGLSVLVNHVKDDLGVDMAFSNELTNDGSSLTGEAKICVEYDRKGSLVKDVLRDLGRAPGEAAAIGDGDGDDAMFEEVALALNLSGGHRSRGSGRAKSVSGFLDAILAIENHV
ncbi:MAG TPA: HAD-IB family phosphatase [Syntrophorhabdaceae bacterium]|nr:HAD-IB family phosphatase [Syntrophorhabdaceae bacterium]